MHSPPVTTKELLDENRRLREQHQKELATVRSVLRDEFATAAIVGRATVGRSHDTTLTEWAERLAAQAYAIADAMLAERQKGGGA